MVCGGLLYLKTLREFLWIWLEKILRHFQILYPQIKMCLRVLHKREENSSRGRILEILSTLQYCLLILPQFGIIY